jgi:predicted enzyme related to lactoylglutathione lyase
MINGAHVILYSSAADEVRAILRDVFGWRSVDAGDGWLIFALPPAEVAVHPSDAPQHELFLMCDDLDATITELRDKGVEIKGEPEAVGWGTRITIVLPGNLEVGVYQPRHATAI